MENTSNNLRQKEARLSINPIENNENKIYFVICNSCYWCASYLNIDDLESRVIACHACNSYSTEIVPIETGESFRIGSDHMRGMEIEFLKNNS
jgi:hypothetical protein